jgi:hypothetical protein
MPLFYFHLKVGRDLQPDDIGLDLTSLEVAYLEAFKAAQEMWADLLAKREDPTIRSFEITDETGRELMTVPFSEVLDRARKSQRPPPAHNVKKASTHLTRTMGIAASLTEEVERTRKLLEHTQHTLRRSRSLVPHS